MTHAQRFGSGALLDEAPEGIRSAGRCAAPSWKRAPREAGRRRSPRMNGSRPPVPNPRLLSAGIRASVVNGPDTSIGGQRPGAALRRRSPNRDITRGVSCLTPALPRRPDRRAGAGGSGRIPSCDVPNNRAVTIPAAPAVDYMAWAAATGSTDLGAANHDPLPSRGCFGPFVATTRRPSPQPRGRRPADRERVGSRFRGTVAVTAPTG